MTSASSQPSVLLTGCLRRLEHNWNECLKLDKNKLDKKLTFLTFASRTHCPGVKRNLWSSSGLTPECTALPWKLETFKRLKAKGKDRLCQGRAIRPGAAASGLGAAASGSCPESELSTAKASQISGARNLFHEVVPNSNDEDALPHLRQHSMCLVDLHGM